MQIDERIRRKQLAQPQEAAHAINWTEEREEAKAAITVAVEVRDQGARDLATEHVVRSCTNNWLQVIRDGKGEYDSARHSSSLSSGRCRWLVPAPRGPCHRELPTSCGSGNDERLRLTMVIVAHDHDNLVEPGSFSHGPKPDFLTRRLGERPLVEADQNRRTNGQPDMVRFDLFFDGNPADATRTQARFDRSSVGRPVRLRRNLNEMAHYEAQQDGTDNANHEQGKNGL